MIKTPEILKSMSALASHAQKRHSVIATNIANADTPGFKAKDVKPFAQIYAAHRSADQDDLKQRINEMKLFEISDGDSLSPNGNSVSVETQSIYAAQTKMDHEMAIGVYRKALDLIKLALNKNT